jgi:hypothetical protein
MMLACRHPGKNFNVWYRLDSERISYICFVKIKGIGYPDLVKIGLVQKDLVDLLPDPFLWTQ